MKKTTIELRRVHNVPLGYGLMDSFYDYGIQDKIATFSALNNVYIHNYIIRYEDQPYTDGRFIRSDGWIGGEVKLSHKYFSGCELTPDKIQKPWKFCDKVVYLDIYYYDNNSLLEENKQLKAELKALAEKYNIH